MAQVDPRSPAVPFAVEEDTEHYLVRADGEIRRNFLAFYTEHDTGRIREGYCCLNCGTSQVDHGAPFPEKCWVCGFRMQDKQREWFAKAWQGTIRVGPSTTIDEELAIAEEMEQRKEREQTASAPSIWVPRSI